MMRLVKTNYAKKKQLTITLFSRAWFNPIKITKDQLSKIQNEMPSLPNDLYDKFTTKFNLYLMIH